MKKLGILMVAGAYLLSAMGDEATKKPSTVARVFQTDTNTFIPRLRSLVGTNEWKYEYVAARACLSTNRIACLQESPCYSDILRKYFLANGVNLLPPSALFYNERTGELCVRSTPTDLHKIGHVLQGLNSNK